MSYTSLWGQLQRANLIKFLLLGLPDYYLKWYKFIDSGLPAGGGEKNRTKQKLVLSDSPPFY